MLHSGNISARRLNALRAGVSSTQQDRDRDLAVAVEALSGRRRVVVVVIDDDVEALAKSATISASDRTNMLPPAADADAGAGEQLVPDYPCCSRTPWFRAPTVD
jgi:hypothetical protein